MHIKNGASAPTGSACLEKPELAFRTALEDVFGPLDWLPDPDSTIHRFTVPGDKPGSLNGWYVMYVDGIASGAFGSWKQGGTHTWSSRAPVDYHEANKLREQAQHAKQQRLAEQRQRHRATTEYAQRLWRDARRADPSHPYLVDKRVRSHALRQHRDALLVPLSHNGELVNLQRIYPDGIKKFLYGGLITGCCSPLGIVMADAPLYVCEGWATGATLREATGAAVACAMNAGNLLHVGRLLATRYPSSPLIVAGDDDRETEANGKGNPGREAARQVAAKLGCGMILPEWPSNAPITLTDFNDLHRWLEHV